MNLRLPMNLPLKTVALLLLSLGAIKIQAHGTTEISKLPVNPLSLSGLRELAASQETRFTDEYERTAIDGIKRRVVSFTADGLHQYALILEPRGEAPEDGWPVLLINHGHHPNPPQYGRIASGETDRPGDYYRAFPLAFARQGFMVVVPDFRGHNDSEGLEFAHGPLESNWYARDSVAAFLAIDYRPRASLTDRFMWGSDYPHDEGTHPVTKEHLRQRFAAMEPSEVRKILAGNAAELYDFDLAALQPLADEWGMSPEEMHTPVEGPDVHAQKKLGDDMDAGAL